MSNRETHSPSPEDEQKSSTGSSIVKTPQKKGAKDFIFGKLIGEGSFSTVYLAKDMHTNKEYAIKVCEKRYILREKKQKAIMREKQIMNILNTNPSPFFIQLFCTFQDINRLYFVMNYATRGELLPYIVKVGSFDLTCTQFYAAELLLALEHLQKLSIIHRDFKPENVLLNEKMHIQVTDFGSAKVVSGNEVDANDTPSDNEDRKNSFVGTAQYVSPEMLTGKTASNISDLWAWGCIVYQMLSGLPPFRAPNEYLIFQKIIKLEYDFPDGFPSSAKDLIKKILVIDPMQRLGANDTEGHLVSIKNHSLFDQFQWENLHQQTPPRILPYLPGTSSNEELRSQYEVPDHLEPGLDDKHMTRLLGLGLQDEENEDIKTVEKIDIAPATISRTIDLDKRKLILSNLKSANQEDIKMLIEQQSKENPWHRFVQGNLILKQGLVEKRRGLFAKKRMLLLTTGPRLFYVDPGSQVLKGEIPWCQKLRSESKTFRNFFVHTPKRTYYLEDPEGYAMDWCHAIEKVRMSYSNVPQENSKQ